MKKLTKIILSALIVVAVFVWVQIVKGPSADEIKGVNIYFLDVGQGDAELIQKGDYQILIDGGPDNKVLSEIGKIMPLNDRKIDQIILTHPHSDHLVGLIQILDRYEIGAVYSTGVLYDSSIYQEFLDKIKTKNIKYEIPEIGTVETPFQDAEISFLWPGAKLQDKEIANLNDASEVTKFCYLSHCSLFTGDLETDGQEEMLSYYSSLGKTYENIFNAGVLKIPHHGSSNGTNQALLDAVSPKYAAIEVGADNKYGHPHAGTIDMLQKAKIQTLRTDQSGTIQFTINELGVIKK